MQSGAVGISEGAAVAVGLFGGMIGMIIDISPLVGPLVGVVSPLVGARVHYLLKDADANAQKEAFEEVVHETIEIAKNRGCCLLSAANAAFGSRAGSGNVVPVGVTNQTDVCIT